MTPPPASTLQPLPSPSKDIPIPPIAIIGGGIGGVSLAIGLAARNVPFHIYESAPSFGEIGAGITFGPNVIRAIHGLSPAMLHAYARHVTANEPEELADAFLTYRKGFLEDGQVVGGQEEYRAWTPEQKFNLRGKVQEVGGIKFPVRCCVHRAHVLDEWVRLLPPDSATFGKALVKIVEDERAQRVNLTFSDGSTATASGVVGCDGIKSVTRKYLHGEQDRGKAKYSGFFGYRAMAPRGAFLRALGPELTATGNLFLCQNGYTIAYPVDHGVALNMFATCIQKEGTTWEDSEWKVPSSEEELRRDLKGWHPGVIDLLVQHGNGEKWAMFHSPHDEVYHRGRVCIMGDAAHATTPHLGAGAGMAIEDAFVLSGLLLASARDSGGDIPSCFEAYDAVRRPRSQRVVRESSDNVAKYCAISSAQGGDFERLKGEAHELGEWLWDFDLDGSLEEGIRTMREREKTQKSEKSTAKL